MSDATKLMYMVECMTCGGRFLVSNSMSNLPKHLPKGWRGRQDDTDNNCSGSGFHGKLIQSVYIQPEMLEEIRSKQ
ncbi:MAG: hypothetical protein PHO26_08665 [Dehalococcoidia bacterium]|nr:hypothetical protein [Dehalococcoidia bacterium]MDD5495043.1 hypothetical protein [Dehalococcoidia bacterium]